MSHWRLFPVAVLALAAAIGFIGCRTVGGYSTRDELPTPTPAAASTVGLSSTDISDAQHLYVARCARCHKFYDPLQYDNLEWSGWMRKMSRKARLKSDEEALLTQYFDAVRNGHPPVNDTLQ